MSYSLQAFKQACFSRAYAGLSSQGWEPCLVKDYHTDRDVCSYSTKDGHSHCAIGWLLPIEKVWSSREGVILHGSIDTIQDPILNYLVVQIPKQDAVEHQEYFLRELQEAHDNIMLRDLQYGSKEALRTAFSAFAATHNLEIPNLEELKQLLKELSTSRPPS